MEKDHNKTENSNLILLNKGTKLIVKAVRNSEFLVIAGKPIGEPIAKRWSICYEYKSRNTRSNPRL